jgi:UDP-N-acetylmuramate--alanine ligase
MSAIASVLVQRGFNVTGSDVSTNESTRKLERAGALIFEGHAAANLQGADLVVTSTAIAADNPERQAAEARGLTIWRRARVLAAIMRGGRSVAVSGTHGKTTTTSMLGLMLALADFDPTVLIGGELNDFGGNARPGQGEWVVAEADESDASFLEMEPDRIIVTNIDADHLDYYADLEAIVRTFGEFFGHLRPNGKLIACLDNPMVARLVAPGPWPVITYSLENPAAQMCATDVQSAEDGRGSRFKAVWRGEPLDEFHLRIPGRHNILNALGALACALDIGAPLEPLRRALGIFMGAKRRFQVKGIEAGVTVVDDYGHHPTEIAATLAAAREQVRLGGGGRLVGVFQPHRYSRTLHLAKDFGSALMAIVTDVYGAGEKPIDGVSGRLVFEALIAQGHANAHYLPTLEGARAFLAERLERGDLFLTIGAGNVWKIGEQVLEDLRLREGESEGEHYNVLRAG